MNMDDLTTELAGLIEQNRTVRERIAQLCLYAIVHAAHEHNPAAKWVALDWSDQGDYLWVTRLLDADKHELDAGEVPDDTYEYASWLDDSTSAVWGTFTSQTKAGSEYLIKVEEILETIR